MPSAQKAAKQAHWQCDRHVLWDMQGMGVQAGLQQHQGPHQPSGAARCHSHHQLPPNRTGE